MLLFIGLVLVGVIINLFYGDYINALYGIFIIIVVYSVSLFWDSSEKYGKLILVIISIAVLVGSLKIMDVIEITPQQYEELSIIKIKFPQLSKQIKKAIQDGDVSIMENHTINKEYQELRKEKAINDIKQ